MKMTLLWPPELVITESMFRHFTGLAEVAGYLQNNSRVRKKSGFEIQVIDCAVETVTALNLAKCAYESAIVAIYVNMNNIKEAMETARFLKSVNEEVKIVVYGEAVACNPEVFVKKAVIDYAIANGQVEYALEYLIMKTTDKALMREYDVPAESLSDNNGVVSINQLLPEEQWGLPDFSIIPVDEYLKLTDGEIHLLVNKGCPFHCEFCNERIVSSHKLYYRDQDQVVDYICADYDERIQSLYLDASTFTYNKAWIMEFADKIKGRGRHLKWKTCTRLDCLDEELVKAMAESGCVRISIGVETFDKSIQRRNRKVVDDEKLIAFASWCHKYGILPRALLILGLEGQNKEDISVAKEFCSEHGIDARFRVLQDYNALFTCKDLDDLDITRLDRWNTWNPFQGMSINELRSIEYPISKSRKYNYV